MRPAAQAASEGQSKAGCKLLVVVHCPPENFEARRGIRNTYGQYVKRGVAGPTLIIFLIGKRSGMSRFQRRKLQQEQELFGDILQVSIFVSKYVIAIGA